jgi:hypothetical protein
MPLMCGKGFAFPQAAKVRGYAEQRDTEDTKVSQRGLKLGQRATDSALDLHSSEFL